VPALEAQISELQQRLALLEDRAAIERLQYQYGFYLDNRMWREVADLFADTNASIEIGQRGKYVGRQRIHRFLHCVLGQGRWGLLRDEVINHIQLQMVITVAADGRTAKARSRAIVQGSSPPGTGTMLWAEGIYENEYIKDDGVWRIRSLWWVPTYYVRTAVLDKVVFESAPPDRSFPPDQPSVAADTALGRGFVPFHYVHPITAMVTPAPVGK
jgi:hypothetical protein